MGRPRPKMRKKTRQNEVIAMGPEEIRQLMRDLGWGPWELGRAVGVSPYAIMKYVRGERKPPEPVLRWMRLIRHNVDSGKDPLDGIPMELIAEPFPV